MPEDIGLPVVVLHNFRCLLTLNILIMLSLRHFRPNGIGKFEQRQSSTRSPVLDSLHLYFLLDDPRLTFYPSAYRPP